MRAISLTALLAIALAAPSSVYAQKEAFLAQKCNRCHAISALGIEKKAGDDEEEEDEGAETPDLSHVGKYHDAAYLSGFLEKKTEHTAHEGVTATGKHKTKFKGDAAELKAMSEWLATLK